MDTVRLARDMGTVDRLFPAGVTDLLDLPHTIFTAIHHAMQVLSWQDNLDADEIPPKRIWLQPNKIKVHLDAVRARRRDGSGGGHGSTRVIDDPVQNQAAKGLIVG